MNKPHYFFGSISLKIMGLALWRMAFIFLLIVPITSVSFWSCAYRTKSLDDAIQTTNNMRGKSFVPPPRSIDDILTVIAMETKKDALDLQETEKQLKNKIPENATSSEIFEFYKNRGQAAFELGLFEQSRDDFQLVLNRFGKRKAGNRLIKLLAESELNLQNYGRAVALFASLIGQKSQHFEPYANLAYIFAITGAFEKAEAMCNEGLMFHQSRPYTMLVSEVLFKSKLEYTVLNIKGKYEEAEPFIRKAVTAAIQLWNAKPHLVQKERIVLVRNLIDQNRLVEAEIEARGVIDKSIQMFGTKSTYLIDAMTVLSEVLLSQGRLNDAEKVCRTTLQAYEQLNVSSMSVYCSQAINTLGKILVTKGDYSGAMEQYNIFLRIKDFNRNIYDRFYSRNYNVMLALIMTNRNAEAKELIESAYQISEKLLGNRHPLSAELLGLLGMVNNSMGNLESAYYDFAEAIPLIAKSKTYAENRLSKHRFMVILESYLSLLSKLRGSLIEKGLSISATDKAFEISPLLSNSIVQTAVLSSIARMSISDPALQELARTEQDVQQQITAYQNLIQDMLARAIGSSDSQGINNVKTKLDKLSSAREVLTDEIRRQIPDYANLVNSQQPSLLHVRSKISPEELVISICSTENHTFVFSLAQTGPVEMAVVAINKKDLKKLVSDLKYSLSPESVDLRKLPSYDFGKAYELYSLLLKPIEKRWKDAKHLIFEVLEPLNQLPFALLTTEPFQLEGDNEVLFSNYRDAPYLIKRVSITMVPSVSSFVTLRERPGSAKANATFAGFGDPIFNKTQLIQALNEKKLHSARGDTEQVKLDIRGIRLTKNGGLDNRQLTSCTIETLGRLPDTSDELISIAEALGANPVRDVYLGLRASEKKVKSMDLSNRRIVVFASHALVPYDLDGLDQPAIALSAPSVTGDEDDGLLTMAEILNLKLDADWVVLSACNTGAADGAGTEAVSGLGRAFFYAGTRALLVSMWPVETTSAKKLTTALFRHLKENPGFSKAQAHQKAMLELINGPGMLDEDGRIIASYAHPFFWAPFIVVGDSGITNLN